MTLLIIISAEKLQELLRNVSNIENINIAGKEEIVRLIKVVFALLELVEKRTSLGNKLLCNNDEYIAELVRSKLSNEWLWIVAIYLLQGHLANCKNLAIKYRLFEHIQHLNEYSSDELGALPNGSNELFPDENSCTPKAYFVRDSYQIEYLLNHIRSEFLPQE